MAKTRTLSSPLFFGYSFSSNPDYAYCKFSPDTRVSFQSFLTFTADEFSTEWGNPWAVDHNTLSPGDGCEAFDCQGNDAGCYSTPAHKKVYGCPQPVTLTAKLCV